MRFAAIKRSVADSLRLGTELYLTKYYALGPKQRTQLQKYFAQMWKYNAIPEGLDGHFKSCPWGMGAECGPDTCECCYLCYTTTEMEKFAEEIKNIPDDTVLQYRPDRIMSCADIKLHMAAALRLITELYVTKYYAMAPEQRNQLQKFHEKLWKYYAIPEGLAGHFQSCDWGKGATDGLQVCDCIFVNFTATKELEKFAAEMKNIPDDPLLQ
jgi:hypothetical protein